jgi:hypothetical protein
MASAGRKHRGLRAGVVALWAAVLLLAGCTSAAAPAVSAPLGQPGSSQNRVIALTSMSTLRSLFNRAQGHPRLVLIFSPT